MGSRAAVFDFDRTLVREGGFGARRGDTCGDGFLKGSPNLRMGIK